MIDTGKRLCKRPGCIKEAAHGGMVGGVGGGGGAGGNGGGGAGGDNRLAPDLCAQHAAESARAARSQLPRNKCKWAAEDCKVRPFYGVPGSRNPEFCARHSFEGLVDLRGPGRSKTKADGGSGKTTAADGGVGGVGVRVSGGGGGGGGSSGAALTPVAQPSKTGGRRVCSYPDCPTRPTYGWKGNTTRECCAKHAQPGMVDVATKRCVRFHLHSSVRGLTLLPRHHRRVLRPTLPTFLANRALFFYAHLRPSPHNACATQHCTPPLAVETAHPFP